MTIKNLLLVFLFLFLSAAGFSQDDKKESKSIFSISGEFRNRTEMSPSLGGRNVLVPDGTNTSFTIWQRSRILMTYSTKKLETKFSIQDVRPFVQNSSSWLSNNGASLAVHEAWAKYYFINNESRKLGLKIGRQELNNPDGRVLWYRNWNHYAASHDALTLECNNIQFDAEWQLGFSVNSTDYPGTATLSNKKYRNIGFFNFSKNFGKSFTLNITDLFETYENGGISDAIYGKNTIGLNPVIKFSGFKFNGSFYYQHGTPAVFNGTEKFAAMMYTANLSYKIGKIKAGAGYDNYSGEAYDDDQTDDKNKVYNTYIHGGHRFFGNTDFHLKLYGKNRGLSDINVKFNAVLTKKTSLYAGFHMISFAKTNVYTDDELNTVEFTKIGNNIDIVLKQKLAKMMFVQLGYSLMLPSDEFVQYTLGTGVDAKFHGWGWLMFTFKPDFFSVEK